MVLQRRYAVRFLRLPVDIIPELPSIPSAFTSGEVEKRSSFLALELGLGRIELIGFGVEIVFGDNQ